MHHLNAPSTNKSSKIVVSYLNVNVEIIKMKITIQPFSHAVFRRCNATKRSNSDVLKNLVFITGQTVVYNDVCYKASTKLAKIKNPDCNK